MGKLGERLLNSAREARAIARGTLRSKDYGVHVPEDIDVREIRRTLRLTQAEFAGRFGIPAATLREWEQGRRRPEGPARALLTIIKNEPRAAQRALKHERA